MAERPRIPPGANVAATLVAVAALIALGVMLCLHEPAFAVAPVVCYCAALLLWTRFNYGMTLSVVCFVTAAVQWGALVFTGDATLMGASTCIFVYHGFFDVGVRHLLADRPTPLFETPSGI